VSAWPKRFECGQDGLSQMLISSRDVLSFNVVKNSGTLADQVGRRGLSTSQADAARDAAAGSLE